MSITLTKHVHHYVTGDRWRAVYILAADNNYTTGYALKPSDLSFMDSDPEFELRVDNTNGWGARYDFTNHLLIFYASAGVLATNPTDLSGLTDVRLTATSKYLH